MHKQWTIIITAASTLFSAVLLFPWKRTSFSKHWRKTLLIQTHTEAVCFHLKVQVCHLNSTEAHQWSITQSIRTQTDMRNQYRDLSKRNSLDWRMSHYRWGDDVYFREFQSVTLPSQYWEVGFQRTYWWIKLQQIKSSLNSDVWVSVENMQNLFFRVEGLQTDSW